MSAIERLEGLLDKKDAEIANLCEKLQEAEFRVEQAKSGWTMHITLEGEQTLPVPRLEMLYESENDNWFDFKVKHRLVYRHFLGHCEAIPLGETKSGGSRGDPPIYNDKIELPFRDGAHIAHNAAAMGFPAFAVLGDRVEKIEPHLRKRP